MAEPIKVFQARKIYTLNHNTPVATHVAVRDGRILGVGTAEELALWGEIEVDTQFADKILLPGFVEAHTHAIEGAWSEGLYLGFFERTNPDGQKIGGYKSVAEALGAIKAADAAMTDPDKPLICWGYDPIYFDNQRMVAADLDAVSSTRMIMVLHQSGHLMNVNSAIMAKAGITRATNVEGVHKDEKGEPTGELQEMAAMFMARKALDTDIIPAISEKNLVRYAASATIAGVTTAVDLGNRMAPEDIALMEKVTSREEFALRIAPALGAMMYPLEEGLARYEAIKSVGNDKLHTGVVKIVTDGSIQGFTARMKWPGHFNGAPNGIWNAPPEQLKAEIVAYHNAGAHVHIHTNGDQASELALDAFEEGLKQSPNADQRHTLQHCQMADEGQFQRMANMGISANLFANHIYYWGDQHYALTMGPDRANRMDACATALRMGVHLGIHCDVPVTPLAPLFTAWCAVNRLTATGRVLGEAEKISVADAIHTITMGAAYQLRLDHLVGSIAIGKFADFAVLEADPFEVEPVELKDVPVWGTVVGGVVHKSGAAK